MVRKIQKRLKDKWPVALQIPEDIWRDFLRESVRKNNISMQIICAIIFPVEIFNIVRVLFWSRSGLRTQNNRIYFSMYCLLILLGVLWLALRRLLRKASVDLQWTVQYALANALFLWHMGLNTYDLYRDPAAGTTVLTTALLGLALFIQEPPTYSTVQYLAWYLLFRVVMAPWMEAGDRLNLTITFVVALAVCLANAHHTAVTLKQQKQIVEMNDILQGLVQQDQLTGLLNKTTVERRVERLLEDSEYTARTGGLTLFLFDLDEFKGINDRYGHPCGDHVLAETAGVMRCVFPDAAALGRIGGDEFAVLYDRPITEAQARLLGERLVEQLGAIQWQTQPLAVQCSVGVCVCTRPGCTYQQVYAETDRMLYQAKKNGKGRCYVRRLECPARQESKR